MNKKLMLIFFLIGLWPYMVLGMENKSLLFDKPYFTLSIKSKGLLSYSRINGVTVFKEYSDGIVEVEIPVNHWMTPDENQLEVILKPLQDGAELSSDSYFEVVLKGKGHGGDSNQSINIVDIVFDGKLLDKVNIKSSVEKSISSKRMDSKKNFMISKQGDVVLHDVKIEKYNEELNFYRLNRKVNIPSQLPEWAFLKSDLIPDISERAMKDEEFDRFLDSLLKEYLKVFEAIKNNNIESIMPMFEERNRETDAAFYYVPGTTEKKIKETLNDAAVDGDAELVKLNANYVLFDIFTNNRLARLIREDDSKAIVQNFKKAQGSQSFDLIFRYKNGKWILTR